MRLLLDAHVLLWFAFSPGRIPGLVRASIEDTGNALLVSIATVWELAIKARSGKLQNSTVPISVNSSSRMSGASGRVVADRT